MTEAVTPSREAGPLAEAPPGGQPSGSRARRRWLVLAIAAVVAAGLVPAWRAGLFAPAGSAGSGLPGARPPATAAVTRRDIEATTPVTATLGYAGPRRVLGPGAGTLTWLPVAGRVVRQGHVLYRVDDGLPVVLMYGRVPAWRPLREGLTGADVSQLNHDLVALGDASGPEVSGLGWDYFSWETVAGVQKLESRLGVSDPAGSLSLGRVVFEPGALRVAAVPGTLGGPAAGSVLTATSDRQVVTIALDVSEQTEVRPGEDVAVSLPDGTTTGGVISFVGAVATTSESGGNATTTIPVQVDLTDPSAARGLDQAPVTVNIVTAKVTNVLVVPVTALLARAPDGYVVEVVGRGNTRRYVAVRPGIFDAASGLVQVTGALTPGQRVVVAS